MEQNAFLGSEKIGKLLRKFAIPCVISLLITALYNVVDQILIGNSSLGYLGNATTGIIFPILILTQAFSWCIADGCAAFLSICQGKKDTKNSHKSIGTGIVINMIISIILMTLGLSFKDPILRLFGASDQTIEMSKSYLKIVASFFPIFMFSNGLNAVIRSDGKPFYSMLSMAAGAVANIILDPIFIFGFNWGIEGAAWATVIGQTVSGILTFIWLFHTKTFRLKRTSFIPNMRIFKENIKLGISSFVTQLSIVVISLACNIVLAKYGALSRFGPDIPILVISIETKVFTVLINIVVGIVLGAQPILGYNKGAGNIDRVKKTYKLVALLTIGVGVLFTVINEIYSDLFILPFGNGGELYMEFARKTFRIFLSLMVFTCLIKVTSIFFQSIGCSLKATISSLIRDIICFIPLCIFLPMIVENNYNGMGLESILFAAPIADLIAMIVRIILLISEFRKMNKIKDDLVLTQSSNRTNS